MIEYAGEIVTHENAHKLRGEYDMAKLRYFRFFICYSINRSRENCRDSNSWLNFSSCFASTSRNLLMIDGHRMSNIARFISCRLGSNNDVYQCFISIKKQTS